MRWHVRLKVGPLLGEKKQQTPGADWTPFGRPALGPWKVRDKETTRGTKRKTRSPRQRLEMVVRVRPVLALIFVPLFAQPPRQTIYHNEGNGSFEQNSLAPGESLQQWNTWIFLK
ncbi:uncharacterized protein LOC143302899 [Bombus vancouverensis nearcticus]|uniref:uncharacterized protein LOC143302899 n=1 Tax=Bombus vancouverensis nearcticus TaxID=2705178 RepID=UPI00402B3356